ncbi:MAG: HPr family phosphocarrier protein [Candidatus Sumerlaeia bacterium]|nr:HPr family phosphocarrier protein [Candidatus Sumerlaeia bacterium]
MDSTISDTFAEVCVTITNKQGMHGRPASQFVRVAGQFPAAEISVRKDGFEVSGKSIFGLMMLAAGPGTKLTICARGQGAADAAGKLRDLIASGFGEELA